jgi:hypothetical protein
VTARWFRALALFALAGCYSFTVAGRARTVARGHLELFAAPGASGIAVSDGADPNLRPRLSVGVRYGATDSLELDARAGDSGGSLATRVQLLRAPDGQLGLDLLVAPGLQYTIPDKLAIELPIVAGLALPNGDEVILAPRVADQFRFGVAGLGHPAQFTFVGASVGYAWQFRPHVALVPELGVLENVYSEPGFGSLTSAGPALEAIVAVLWDR